MDAIKKLLKLNKENSKKLLTRVKNGRVNILGKPTSVNAFPLFEETNRGNSIYINEALKSILGKTKLHDIFFSEFNINNLQKIIRYNVWLQSDKKHVVGRQSDDQLKIIMRSVFLQYGKHNDQNINQQIMELNEIVCNYSIPNILSNLEQYIGYKNHISKLPEPIPLPKNLSSTRLKSLRNFN